MSSFTGTTVRSFSTFRPANNEQPSANNQKKGNKLGIHNNAVTGTIEEQDDGYDSPEVTGCESNSTTVDLDHLLTDVLNDADATLAKLNNFKPRSSGTNGDLDNNTTSSSNHHNDVINLGQSFIANSVNRSFNSNLIYGFNNPTSTTLPANSSQSSSKETNIDDFICENNDNGSYTTSSITTSIPDNDEWDEYDADIPILKVICSPVASLKPAIRRSKQSAGTEAQRVDVRKVKATVKFDVRVKVVYQDDLDRHVEAKYGLNKDEDEAVAPADNDDMKECDDDKPIEEEQSKKCVDSNIGLEEDGEQDKLASFVNNDFSDGVKVLIEQNVMEPQRSKPMLEERVINKEDELSDNGASYSQLTYSSIKPSNNNDELTFNNTSYDNIQLASNNISYCNSQLATSNNTSRLGISDEDHFHNMNSSEMYRRPENATYNIGRPEKTSYNIGSSSNSGNASYDIGSNSNNYVVTNTNDKTYEPSGNNSITGVSTTENNAVNNDNNNTLRNEKFHDALPQIHGYSTKTPSTYGQIPIAMNNNEIFSQQERKTSAFTSRNNTMKPNNDVPQYQVVSPNGYLCQWVLLNPGYQPMPVAFSYAPYQQQNVVPQRMDEFTYNQQSNHASSGGHYYYEELAPPQLVTENNDVIFGNHYSKPSTVQNIRANLNTVARINNGSQEAVSRSQVSSASVQLPARVHNMSDNEEEYINGLRTKQVMEKLGAIRHVPKQVPLNKTNDVTICEQSLSSTTGTTLHSISSIQVVDNKTTAMLENLVRQRVAKEQLRKLGGEEKILPSATDDVYMYLPPRITSNNTTLISSNNKTSTISNANVSSSYNNNTLTSSNNSPSFQPKPVENNRPIYRLNPKDTKFRGIEPSASNAGRLGNSSVNTNSVSTADNSFNSMHATAQPETAREHSAFNMKTTSISVTEKQKSSLNNFLNNKTAPFNDIVPSVPQRLDDSSDVSSADGSFTQDGRSQYTAGNNSKRVVKGEKNSTNSAVGNDTRKNTEHSCKNFSNSGISMGSSANENGKSSSWTQEQSDLGRLATLHGFVPISLLFRDSISSLSSELSSTTTVPSAAHWQPVQLQRQNEVSKNSQLNYVNINDQIIYDGQTVKPIQSNSLSLASNSIGELPRYGGVAGKQSQFASSADIYKRLYKK